MPDGKLSGPDEVDDEMPDTGGAPCGDIFGTSQAASVTNADVIPGDQGG